MWALGPQAARLFLIQSVSFDAPALPGRPGLLFPVASKWSHNTSLLPRLAPGMGREVHGVSRPFSGSSGERNPCTGAERAASLADIALHRALTPAAGDVATPVVLAVTALHHAVRVGVVAAPTAHEVAAVTPVGGFVALPGGGSERLVSAHHHQHLPLPAKQPAPSPLWVAQACKKGDLSGGKPRFPPPLTSLCLQ